MKVAKQDLAKGVNVKGVWGEGSPNHPITHDNILESPELQAV
jgi:hypothetical protein